MSDIVERLRRIADAARREDGSGIPLGDVCREAVVEIASLRFRIKRLRSAFESGRLHGIEEERKSVEFVVARIREIINIGNLVYLHEFPSMIDAALHSAKERGLKQGMGEAARIMDAIASDPANDGAAIFLRAAAQNIRDEMEEDDGEE